MWCSQTMVDSALIHIVEYKKHGQLSLTVTKLPLQNKNMESGCHKWIITIVLSLVNELFRLHLRLKLISSDICQCKYNRKLRHL